MLRLPGEHRDDQAARVHGDVPGEEAGRILRTRGVVKARQDQCLVPGPGEAVRAGPHDGDQAIDVPGHRLAPAAPLAVLQELHGQALQRLPGRRLVVVPADGLAALL
ncbi:hypothetical protein [Streptomyces sp. NBC_01221]|uniref:hypothetical protein n=1 Tax=Streptomyces sp. NBC_01221 TaxID=2903782 RepID=UPI00224FD699|nr:hypothetical protein [Streptomyces sp. NBC_01221]